MKFRFKLIISFFAMSFTVVVLFSLLQYRSSSRYILTLEQIDLTEKSIIIQKQMDHYLMQAGNLIRTLAVNRQIKSSLSEASFGDMDEINSLFDNILEISPEEYSAIFVTDRSGICRASTDRRFIDTDYSFRTYYQEVVDIGSELFISDYSIGLHSLIPGVFLSVPLEDEKGALLGVLILKINATYFQNIIEDLNSSPGPYETETSNMKNIRMLKPIDYPKPSPETFIMNKDGIIILHPDESRLFHSTLPLPTQTLKRLQESQQFLDRQILSLNEPVLDELHKKTLLKARPMASVYRDVSQSQWNVLALAPMTRNDWCVGVSLSYSEFRLFSRDLLVKTLLMGFLLLVASVILAFYLARVITGPMNHLLKVISQATEKNWSIRLSVLGRDEFSYLGKRFNDLLEIIEDYSLNMEAQVQDRTSEVIALQKENTRLRIIEEKEQLYRDLHDSLGARLTNINICNNVAQSGLQKNPAILPEMMNRIEVNCNQAIEDMKNLIEKGSGRLRNEILLGDPMIQRFQRRLDIKGISFSVSLPESDHWRSGIGKASLHEVREILEEMISNVLKHSRAKSVTLRIDDNTDSCTLLFQDDGIGMNWPTKTRGYGLGSIEKRVQRIGGTLNIQSELEKGTSFRIIIPRQEKDQE